MIRSIRHSVRRSLSPPPHRTLEPVAWMQAILYLATGIWPLVHMRSFVAVTGPKVDLWLVKTVGLLVGVVGAVLGLAAWRKQLNEYLRLIAVGCAAALSIVDVVYVAKRRISPVYLLDAIAELLLIVLWIRGMRPGTLRRARFRMKQRILGR